MLYTLQVPPLMHLGQIKALFSFCFREATTFPEVWQSVAVTAAEEVRGLPDAVGNVPFPSYQMF